MPTYTHFCGSFRHEIRAIEAIENVESPHLHLWPSLTRMGTNEVDILIADVHSGLYCVEMKSHRIDQIVAFSRNEWQLEKDDQVRQSPLLQASRASQQLSANFQERQVEHGWITPTVYWTDIDRNAWEHHFSLNPDCRDMADGMLFRDDVGAGAASLEQALVRIRQNCCVGRKRAPEPLDSTAIDELIALLADNSAPVTPQAEADRLRLLETRQARQAERDVPLDTPTRLIVKGPPGTGKTWALLAVAKHHAEAGRRVLFLCYNEVLHTDLIRIANQFESRAFLQNGDIFTLFGFYEHFRDFNNIDVFAYEDARAQEWISEMARNLETAKDHPVYDLIVVDEAQDMLPEVGTILDHCLADDGSIVAAVGPGQELYTNETPWLDALQARSKVFEFKNIYRNTAATFCVAQCLLESSLENSLITPHVRKIVEGQCSVPEFWTVDLCNPGTTVPAFHYLRDPKAKQVDLETHWTKELGDVVESAIRRLRGNENRSDILFLLPSSRSVLREPLIAALHEANIGFVDLIADKKLFAEPHQVRLSTYHSARGVEATIVVLLDLGKLMENTAAKGTTTRLAFIALTRSLRDTIVVEEKNHPSRLGAMIQEIGQRVRVEMERDRPRFRELSMENLPDGYFDER